MSAFASAIAVLFRNPHLAADAVYRAGGDPMAEGLPVRVMTRAPDRFANFAEGRFVTESILLDVRTCDVERLERGDTFEIDGLIFEVRSDPVRDSERLVWAAEARPL